MLDAFDKLSKILRNFVILGCLDILISTVRCFDIGLAALEYCEGWMVVVNTIIFL